MITLPDDNISTGTNTIVTVDDSTTPTLISSEVKKAANSGLESLTNNTLCKWDSTTSKMVAITTESDIPTHVYVAGTYSGGFATFYILGYRGVISGLVVSEAVTIGDLLFVAASAKCSKLPATAGTYYQVGQALSDASANGTCTVNTQIPLPVKVA
jgi:hypothetical protein